MGSPLASRVAGAAVVAVVIAAMPLSCVSSDEDAAGPGWGGAGAVDTGPRVAPDCSADHGLEFFVIDDFELGAATTAFTNNDVCYRCSLQEGEGGAGGFGAVDSECEADCRSSQSPNSFETPLYAELIPEGRCESRYALHLTGGPFTEWGGLVGFPFAPGVDATEFDGVSFWGRVAWGTRSTVRLAALDPETDSSFQDESGESRCAGESSLDNFSEACDPFGSYAVMTGNWRFFKLPFEELRQKGYGHKAPYLDLGFIRQIAVEYGQGSWDFWIDDLAFYRDEEASQ